MFLGRFPQFLERGRLTTEPAPESQNARLEDDAARDAKLPAEIRNLTIMGMRPGLTREKKTLLHDLERSARAELKLRHKAIEYYLSHRSS
jgi:hypothetical protein